MVLIRHLIVRTDAAREQVVYECDPSDDVAAVLHGFRTDNAGDPVADRYRVATLTEAVEPTRFIAAATFNGAARALTLGGLGTIGTREEADRYAEQHRRGGGATTIFGLVPVKDGA